MHDQYDAASTRCSTGSSGTWRRAEKTDVSLGRQGYAVHIAGDPPFDFVGFSWPPGVIEPALERCGLADVQRHPVTVPADAVAERGADYWTGVAA
jgi:toxoflavin synthase